MADNPSAFPVSEVRDAYGQGLVEGSPGMTLRDWFAGQALPAVCASMVEHERATGKPYPDANATIASAAYRVADAMLAARSSDPA